MLSMLARMRKAGPSGLITDPLARYRKDNIRNAMDALASALAIPYTV
jgi:hypothetical protein